jgi:RES domain-containing protein
MALVWRLARPEFASQLDGKGNSVTGARWNSPGRGALYASCNLSLCVLESFVHLPPFQRIHLPEMMAVHIEIPDQPRPQEIDLSDLPTDLTGTETIVRCREIGDAWLASQGTLVLTMPSMIVAQERNVMINPAHRLMAQVKIVSIERFRFDSRLAAPPPA